MSSENNKWTGDGRLGKDPDYKTGSRQNGGTWEMCKMSIACEREDEDKVKDKEGNLRYKSDWINVKCWGELANAASEYKKGDMIHVEGRLENNNWEDKNKVKHYDMDVMAEVITASDEAKGSTTVSGTTSYNPKKDYNGEEVKKQIADEYDVDPDELPF